MNKHLTAFLTTGGVAALTLIADKGEAFVNALAAIPALLKAWTQDTPIGGWALVCGLVIPMLAMVSLDRWVPDWPEHTKARTALLEVGAALLAVWIVFMLLPGLPGLLLGVVCGLLAPWLTRGVASGVRWITRP